MLRALHRRLTIAIAAAIAAAIAVAVAIPMRRPAAMSKRTSTVFSKHHCTLRIRGAAV
jgi:hypothetical protein